MDSTEIRVRGVSIRVPCTQIDGRTVVVTGKWIKVAAIKDEDFQEGDLMSSPELFIARLQQQTNLAADVFTFSQKPTDPTPHFRFAYEWDSVAAIPIVSFADWWGNRVSRILRQDVKKASKLGVVVRPFRFSDDLVRGIVEIYDEKPIRQGRSFWHYKKGFDAVKLEAGTYLERSEFVGAFLGDELIGFLKVVYVDRLARLMHILAKDAHRDKRPMNALIAKAVELCEARGCSHLTYGKYNYDGINSSLTKFKHRNGFQEILVPKYYIALTTRGRLALRLRLHHGAMHLLPSSARRSLKRLRAFIYRHSGGTQTED